MHFVDEAASIPHDGVMPAFKNDKLIRFHHCDPAGIVFYPQYFVLFNELVEDWFNGGLGIDFAAFHAVDRLGIPMAHLECDFLSTSRVGEVLNFSLAVTKIGRTSLTLAVEARAGDTVRVRATLVVVLASLETHRPVPIPAAMREKLERFRQPAA
jgi:4-hydroxybenzoyl-CoA thioesterase